MIKIRHEHTADIAAREALLDKAMGKIKRRRKTSERLRSGRLPADGLAFVATDGERIVGVARLLQLRVASVYARREDALDLLLDADLG